MYKLKKNGKVFTSKSVGTGPSSCEKRIYWVAVSKRLRNTVLEGRSLGLQTERPRYRGWIPIRGKKFFFFKTFRTALEATQPTIRWVPGVKGPGCENDYSFHFMPSLRTNKTIHTLHDKPWRCGNRQIYISHKQCLLSNLFQIKRQA